MQQEIILFYVGIVAKDNIPLEHCFSVSDFKNSERCFFNFLVTHYLRQRYEFEEGSFNQTIGTILDLVIKKVHASKAYGEPLNYLLEMYFKAAEKDIRQEVEEKGVKSFYGSTIKFLNADSLAKARQVSENYYLKRGGKFNRSVFFKRFWECLLEGERLFKLWGGPDALEMGDDGVVEVVDYKYFENAKKGKDNLDMDLMPKIYILLCAAQLVEMGYDKTRFRVRFWTDPLDESIYEEFDMFSLNNLKQYLRFKIEKILSVKEFSFCEQSFCKVCNSGQRRDWIKQLQTQFKFR